MNWQLTGAMAVASLIGLAGGIGAYTFIYARGASYLTDDPSACANCHIMKEHHDRWVKSSHRHVAVCNDCHTPSGFLAKYATKVSNGFRHSFAFTTGRFHEPLQIKSFNLEIVNQACRKCHGAIVAAIEGPHQTAQQIFCVQCHRWVGHP